MTAILNILLIFGWLFAGQGNTSTTIQTSQEQAWSEDLNTAKSVVYLSQIEKEIVLELNKVRSNPTQYAAEYLEPLRTAYDGKRFSYPGQVPLLTREGLAALEECILALKAAAPAPALTPSKGLTKAAELLVKDQKLYGGTGHQTKSGWTTDIRVKRFGQWKSRLAENIIYANTDPRQIVISLLIDDGTPNRVHRVNILNPEFTLVGVASDSHPEYDYFCTIEFADDFTEKR